MKVSLFSVMSFYSTLPENMLLFNSGDIDALAEQMAKMISNDNL